MWTRYDIRSHDNQVHHSLGDVESTEPTKMLMRIADYIDNGPSDVREWFLNSKDEVVSILIENKEKDKSSRETKRY